MLPAGYVKHAPQRAPTFCRTCAAPGLWWYRDTNATAPRAKKWHLVDGNQSVHRCRPTTAQFVARKEREFEADRRKGRFMPAFKDIARKGTHVYVREAWTLMPQSDLPDDKVFVLERLRYEGPRGETHFGGPAGVREYRFSYFIRRPTGQWTFGQYAPMLPVADLEPLIEKGKAEGTILGETFKYFAYGSNMSTARLKAEHRAPSAKKVGVAELRGHRLRFHKESDDGSGKANAFGTGNDADVVLGVVLEINESDRSCLDHAEGLGKGYDSKRPEVRLLESGEVIKADTYVATADRIDDKISPYKWYRDYVLQGAEEHHLDAGYVAQHIASVTGMPDADEGRHNTDRPCPHRDAPVVGKAAHAHSLGKV